MHTGPSIDSVGPLILLLCRDESTAQARVRTLETEPFMSRHKLFMLRLSFFCASPDSGSQGASRIVLTNPMLMGSPFSDKVLISVSGDTHLHPGRAFNHLV